MRCGHLTDWYISIKESTSSSCIITLFIIHMLFCGYLCNVLGTFCDVSLDSCYFWLSFWSITLQVDHLYWSFKTLWLKRLHGFIDFSFLFAFHFIDLMLFITSLYFGVQFLLFCVLSVDVKITDIGYLKNWWCKRSVL